MNKFFAILALALFMVSCKSSRPIVNGKPSLKKSKDLIEKMEENSYNGDYIKIKGKGIYKNANEEQAFKVEIRIKKDSLIWVELADPFIGIKVARGFVTKDSLLFMNKLSNTFMAGSFSRLNQEIKANLDFEVLQNALLGAPLRKLNPKENNQMVPLEKVYSLYYLPKLDPLFTFGQPNYYMEIDPSHFYVLNQTVVDGGNKLYVEYSQFKEVKKNLYMPNAINLDVVFEENITLQLDYNTLEVDQVLNFPIKLSSKYKKED